MKHKFKVGEKATKIFDVEVKGVDEENFTLEAIFSSKKEDRHGDVVIQDFDLKAFKKNPVILNSHNYGDAKAVIGKAISKTVKVEKGKLQGKIQFAVNENPDAKIIFDLYAGGFLNAFSIGFMPLEFDEKDWSKILRSELLEVSAVSVPANADALAKAKEKGIDIDKLNYVEKNIEDEEDNGEDAEEEDNDSEDGGEESDEKDKKFEGVQKEYADNWDETNEFVRLKVRDIAMFERPLNKATLLEEIPRVFSMVGNMLNEDAKGIQMLFFPKEDGWTVDDAKKWFSSWQMSILYSNQKEYKVGKELVLKRIYRRKFVQSKGKRISQFLKEEKNTERKILLKTKDILEDMLVQKVDVKKINKKKKINQAVRNLLKVKDIK